MQKLVSKVQRNTTLNFENFQFSIVNSVLALYPDEGLALKMSASHSLHSG